jgi:hypothetical protein
MELINDIQLEVTTITIRKNALLNKRRIFFHNRMVFMANIEDIGEESYLHENNYISCGVLMMKSGEWIKVKETYEDLKKIHSEWYKQAVEKEAPN